MVSKSPVIEVAEQTRFDPMRLALAKKAQGAVKRGLARGLTVSLLLHSLPLLTMIAWRPAAVETPAPIPIELTIEQPPPEAATPKPPAAPPPIRGASAEMAEVAAVKPEQGVDNAPPSSVEPPKAEPSAPPESPPQEAEPAAAAAPPAPTEPVPTEEQAQLPTPETKTAAVAPPSRTKPTPHKQQPTPLPSLPTVSAWPLPLHNDRPQQHPRFATLSGPTAVLDEYCVRALNLTLRNLNLLPLSYLGGRRGRTVVTIRILGDGTINSVKLAKSSGYGDIDQRIQRMVFEVGQYPPLPPRMPGPWTDFTFVMDFPHPLER